MNRGMTLADQQTYVGEGLAVGCLNLNVSETTSQKMEVEFAFRHAWGDWTWASEFPKVHASIAHNDVFFIMHKSKGRRGHIVAAWEVGRRLRPYLTMEDSTVEDAADSLQESCGVPLQGWTDLASAFIEDLGPNNVYRSAG